MKVVLTTIGSPGDVLPFVAIGSALGARGHAVHACSWRAYGPLFTSRDMGFTAIGPAFDLDGCWRESIATSLGHADPRVMLDLAFDLFVEREAATRFAACRAAMDGADLAVCNALDLVGQAAAEDAGVPWCTWTSKPLDRATLPHADAFFADLDRRAVAVLEAETGVRLPSPVRALRNLSPVESWFGASPALLPAFDLPPRCRLTGTCFLDGGPTEPPPAVAAFLADGPPPVVVTFGAFGAHLPAEAFTGLVGVVREAGHRALVHAPGHDDLGGGDDLRTVATLAYAPVLPHAAAVVHHGGAGTSAEVVRAGVPSVTLPYLDSDQTFWAGRLHALGLGAEPLMLRDATGAAVLARLRHVLDDPGPRLRTEALRPQLQQEDGAAVIADRAEALVR